MNHARAVEASQQLLRRLARAVRRLACTVREHEVVALLGRNGAGKTTTLKTLAGVLAAALGHDPASTASRSSTLPSHEIAGRGLQLVPEERRIFGTLTVEENLELAALTAPRAAGRFERHLRDLPAAAGAARAATARTLSGGEQQMLAIARALIRRPRADPARRAVRGAWPSIIVQTSARSLPRAGGGRARRSSSSSRTCAPRCSLAGRVYVLNNGHVVFEGTADELRAAPDIINRFLGV